MANTLRVKHVITTLFSIFFEKKKMKGLNLIITQFDIIERDRTPANIMIDRDTM